VKPLLVATLLLSGCVISPLPQAAAPAVVAPKKAVISIPPPVFPDICVTDWYAQADLPDCVKDWIEDVTEQQKKIEKKSKAKVAAQ
jgi:hypothetical protein